MFANCGCCATRIDRTDRLPRIRACLFDMDGLLIDSEDLYTVITNEILQKYGRPLLPWSIKAQMQGRPQPEVRLLLEPVLLHTNNVSRPARSSTILPSCQSAMSN
jgi:phosphoglycolate phosphatase-like HAD superfamily hydrolase